ncbi:topoisomerase C-terminal repeat-containing protein [Proteiniphilum sp. X52]|uniref:topoisomerase C-terminal repeat-containing protein n=1 Tax=Proteiniphilum sp. X52 TaxID=2382159 RepID=UPI001C8779F8|nr:topoisomerase C-terminal repeat-containing protein [Proteiniphilum sp. X52]
MTKKRPLGVFYQKNRKFIVSNYRLSEIDVKAILTNKKSSLLKGLKSKTGKTFDTYIVLKEDGSTEFEFPPADENEKIRKIGIIYSIIWSGKNKIVLLHYVEPAKPLNNAQIGRSFYLYTFLFI